MALGHCQTEHCPRCGYTAPDEKASSLARLVRRLFPARPPSGAAAPVPPAPPQTLAQLRPGDRAVVSGLVGDPSRLTRLTSLGLAPGAPLRVVQRLPSLVIEIGETTLAIERRVAEGIAVRLA
jgi:Fe2+ transport system protein FeoA